MGWQVVYVRNPDYVPRNEAPSGSTGGKKVYLGFGAIPDSSSLGAITRGKRGATLFVNGDSYHVEADAATEVDSTGAGDVFATTLLIEYQRFGDAWDAAAVAACAAAASVEAEGPAAPDAVGAGVIIPLDAYAGRYAAAPDLIYTIKRETDHLIAEREGRAPFGADAAADLCRRLQHRHRVLVIHGTDDCCQPLERGRRVALDLVRQIAGERVG
jgi:hypothetical protein